MQKIIFGDPKLLPCAKGGIWIQISDEEGVTFGGYTQSTAWFSGSDYARENWSNCQKMHTSDFIDFCLNGKNKIERLNRENKALDALLSEKNSLIESLQKEKAIAEIDHRIQIRKARKMILAKRGRIAHTSHGSIVPRIRDLIRF